MFECDREASIMSKPRPDRAVEQWQIRKALYFNQNAPINIRYTRLQNAYNIRRKLLLVSVARCHPEGGVHYTPLHETHRTLQPAEFPLDHILSHTLLYTTQKI